MKVKSIKKNSIIVHTYDLEVDKTHNYILKNGCVVHNSSVVSGETNGIEPPRAFLNVKTSKRGNIKMIVPGYPNLKNSYDLLWDHRTMKGYLSNVAIMQKFVDQSISANTSYNPEHHEDSKIPLKVLMGDILFAHKHGVKTLYYNNTYDLQKEDGDEPEVCDSCTI